MLAEARIIKEEERAVLAQSLAGEQEARALAAEARAAAMDARALAAEERERAWMQSRSWRLTVPLRSAKSAVLQVRGRLTKALGRGPGAR